MKAPVKGLGAFLSAIGLRASMMTVFVAGDSVAGEGAEAGELPPPPHADKRMDAERIATKECFM
jgi:hypothetical protein